MKKLNYLLVVSAALVTSAFSIYAAQPSLSPRALANQIRTVPAGSSANDPDLIQKWQSSPGSPRGKELAYSRLTVPATTSSIDLAHAQRPTLSPKDSRYETALRENAMKEFQTEPMGRP